MSSWAGPCPGQQRGWGGASRGSVKCWDTVSPGDGSAQLEKKRAILGGAGCRGPPVGSVLWSEMWWHTGQGPSVPWAGEELCLAICLAQASPSLPQPQWLPVTPALGSIGCAVKLLMTPG